MNTIKGFFYALAACFLWGLIFVVPLFLSEFSSFEITLGRYFFYGVISLLIFAVMQFRKRRKYPLALWAKAFGFSFVVTILYYTTLVLGVRYASAPLCVLILSTTPIVAGFYANRTTKDTDPKMLVISAGIICIGLFFVMIHEDFDTTFSLEMLFGLIASCVSLLSWVWFIVHNSYFLKKRSDISPNEWVTVIGVATGMWVLLLQGLAIPFTTFETVHKFFVYDEHLQAFLIGCGVLGIGCSWIGGALWNRASQLLPVSLSGQLMIFETIFGILLVYFVEKTVPSWEECVGIVLFLVAIFVGFKGIRSGTDTEKEGVS